MEKVQSFMKTVPSMLAHLEIVHIMEEEHIHMLIKVNGLANGSLEKILMVKV